MTEKAFKSELKSEGLAMLIEKRKKWNSPLNTSMQLAVHRIFPSKREIMGSEFGRGH